MKAPCPNCGHIITVDPRARSGIPERDAQIVASLSEGLTLRELAFEFGLSHERVRQIGIADGIVCEKMVVRIVH